MPVDPAVDPEGTVVALRDVSGKLAGWVLKADEPCPPGYRRYVTHFATCTVLNRDRVEQRTVTQANRQVPNVVRLADRRGPRHSGARRARR